MILIKLIIVILFMYQDVISMVQKPKLTSIFLNVVFRHGEKIPMKSFQNYPNDPHANYSYYPIDDGGLTNAGKKRMHGIGQKFRMRYDHLLDRNYMPKVVYARSSDVPRAQMSLQLVLAGLFPPIEKQIWNVFLPWQPVSTFSISNTHDFLFFPSRCSLNTIATENAMKTVQVKNIIKQHSNTMDYISKNSGKKIESLLDVLMLYNLFEEQSAHNLTLPSWTTSIYPGKMKKIAIEYMNMRSHTAELRRYNGGFLLRKIIENIKAFVNGTLRPSTRKIFFYSGHEFNIMALGRVLGLHYPIYPRHGSVFVFETLQDDKANIYMRIVLWTGITDHDITQRLPSCTEPCPIQQFFQLYENKIPTDEEIKLCERNVLNKTYDLF